VNTHLKNGLVGWLFGALAGAGLALPAQFDLKGIVSLVIQVLGLTYQRLRGMLVKLIGEPKVAKLEKAFDFLMMIVTQGLGAAWQKITEFVGGLQEMVMGGIRDWVQNSIITAAITKLLSMFNPAGAIIQAVMAIYNTIMFFIERGSQIAAVGEAVFSSIGTIAAGNIAGAATYVEQTMGRTLPVVISFLARLIGLGGISEHIKTVIKKIQSPIETAMTKVANFIVEKGKSLLGKGKDNNEGTAQDNKSESEKKHADMGNAAAQQLAKKPSQEMSYEEIRASKEKEAKALEDKYNKELEKPVKMTITFKSPEEDKKDGDMDMHIHIGPNDFDLDVQSELPQNKYKATRRPDGKIEGDFKNFVWEGYPSHAVTPHPVNAKYGHKNGTMVPKPQGKYLVPTGRDYDGAPSTDKWRDFLEKDWKARKADLKKQHPDWSDGEVDRTAKKEIEKNYGMAWLDLDLRGWEAHHIHPRDWGGTDDNSNWQYLKERPNKQNSKANEHSPFTTWWDKVRKPDIENEVK
jgi:hypothetical protein